jgi:aspartyl/glutamyl-tRNA(Asn/Gln) amidotransferase, C subunit
MAVNTEEVKYVAELARLEFGECEIEKFTYDLNDILGYITKLNELDTGSTPVSINPVRIENAFRDDEIEESLSREEVLQNAPDRQDGYFKVPRIIEG